MMRPATPEEIERWDEQVAANPDGGNVLQSRAFAETKKKTGWVPFYRLQQIDGHHLAMLFLGRTTPFGELLYCPKGPGVVNTEQLAQVVDALKSVKPSPAFLVKLEAELPSTDSQLLAKQGLVKARDLQLNASTVVVDLKPSEDDILASFKQKTRYNVRLAAKHGVKVTPVDPTPENMDKMYELMGATQERAGFFLRSKEYFKNFWWEHAKFGVGQLFFAEFEGQVLAGAFVTYLGKKALYKDGGSNRLHSELQAPYLLQWEIMRRLKAKGVEEYDLHGTPPSDHLEDPSHRFHGLARFKTGFGPVVDFVGTYDLVLKPAKYKLWQKFGERFVTAYSHRVKKELFY